MNVSIKKTVALVLALSKLHNYRIDQNDSSDLTYIASDEWQHEVNGPVPLVTVRDSSGGKNDVVPEQLMDGGHHFDDIGGMGGRYNRQRRYNYISRVEGNPLPRERLHSHIECIGLTQPTPVSSTQFVSNYCR